MMRESRKKITRKSVETKDSLTGGIEEYAIFMIDLNGRVASWNKGAEKIKGYRADEIIGQPIEIFYTKEDIGNNVPGHNLEMARERGSFEEEGFSVRKDGSQFWADVVYSCLRDEGGQLIGFTKVTKDISRRKQREEDLHKQNVALEAQVSKRTKDIYYHERRFRALVENTYDIISLLDDSFKNIYRSPSATRVTGWSDEEILTMSGEALVHPDEKKLVGDIFMQTMANPGKAIPLLIRSLHKSGHFIWLEGTITNMLNDEQMNAIVFNVRDATDRIAAAEVLAASETRFRALIENSAEGIALIDEFLNIVYRSPASTKITGYTSPGHSISVAHPEDMLSIETKIEESLRCPGVPVNFQGRFKHALGHYFWMEGSLTNMLDVKGVNAIVSNYRDITERKKTEEDLVNSEKLYRSLFENMLSGFSYCKGIFEEGRLVDFTYLAVNDEYELMTGLKDVQGKNVSEVNPALLTSDQEYGKKLGRVALTGKPERFEAYVERLDKWFSTSLYSPATGYFVGLLDNITERKRAEGKINLLNIELERKVVRRTEELRRKNEELEAFSYSVSHDLRAPLRGIIGFTTILEEEYCSKLDKEAMRLTGVIKNNTQKMGNLIDDLLAFSRMGRHDLNKTHIDSNKLVQQLIVEFDQKSPDAASWIVQPLENMFADSMTISQVWVNLLSNALKYSAGKTDRTIEISSYTEQEQTVFRIRDNGVGFDSKYVGKLFKVFQRLHSTEDFEGTGVGLAIVEKIVSRHGGRVWAESEVNKGASFYFSLPMQ